jgi:hypothetical protein
MELASHLRLHQIHAPKVPLKLAPSVLVLEMSPELLTVTVIKAEYYTTISSPATSSHTTQPHGVPLSTPFPQTRTCKIHASLPYPQKAALLRCDLSYHHHDVCHSSICDSIIELPLTVQLRRSSDCQKESENWTIWTSAAADLRIFVPAFPTYQAIDQ